MKKKKKITMYDARAEFKKDKILVRERTTITGNCPRFSSGAPYFPARPLTAAIATATFT